MNFDGPVRVADDAGISNATVKLSFNSWFAGMVASTTHTIPVLPRMPGVKDEPVSANLITSLIHPDRSANICTVDFSRDGSRLFAAGYPSGIVQIWDLASGKEIRRIDTPPGLRSGADYAKLTPDWSTLYVPVEKRHVKRIERDGKRIAVVEEEGQIRVWDIASGKEKESLMPQDGTAPMSVQVAPNGRFLLFTERPGFDSTRPQRRDNLVLWDLARKQRRDLNEGSLGFTLTPDQTHLIIGCSGQDGQAAAIKCLDVESGKETAKIVFPEKDRWFSVGPVSSDGAVVAIFLSGKKDTPMEQWFLDAKTLATRGKLIGGKPKPGGNGWGNGLFAGDPNRFLAIDSSGDILGWNVRYQKVDFSIPGGSEFRRLALSKNGQLLAIAWMPPKDKELESASDPDPLDLPQPRISIYDLNKKALWREFIAPHGYLGGLAFSPDCKMLAFGSAGAVRLFDLTK